VKRILIAPLLGSLLALGAVSLAAPATSSDHTAIDTSSRLDTHLRAIDGVFFPDSLGAERRQLPDVGCEAPTTDQCFGSGV
jgi:hypothetical protein